MTAPKQIFVFGAGGHGRSVAEVVRREGRYTIACVLDDDEQAAQSGDAPWIGGREKLATLAGDGLRSGFVAIGNNADRELITVLVEAAGLSLVTLVDPAAVVALDSPIGAGSVLMPFSMLGANASLGRSVIMNTSATVDHDCVVEDFAHISVGVHLVGGCRIGARCFLGIGSVLGKPVTLGERVVIGAGAAVLSDIAAGVVAAGVPARELSSVP